MHMQLLYKNAAFVSVNGDIGADIFERGLCLPSNAGMTDDEQDIIIEIVKSCFE